MIRLAMTLVVTLALATNASALCKAKQVAADIFPDDPGRWEVVKRKPGNGLATVDLLSPGTGCGPLTRLVFAIDDRKQCHPIAVFCGSYASGWQLLATMD